MRAMTLILLPNFLHHFDVDGCVTLLKKARASLAPGGRLLSSSSSRTRTGCRPNFRLPFATVMLATTPKGDAYTERELADMARSAGFGDVVTKTAATIPGKPDLPGVIDRRARASAQARSMT